MYKQLLLALGTAFAITSVAACSSVPFEASAGGGNGMRASAKCDAMGDWFERQRQLTDGNVNPRDAAFDPTCRTGHRGA